MAEKKADIRIHIQCIDRFSTSVRNAIMKSLEVRTRMMQLKQLRIPDLELDTLADEYRRTCGFGDYLVTKDGIVTFAEFLNSRQQENRRLA